MMKQNLFTMVITLVLVLSLAACSGSGSGLVPVQEESSSNTNVVTKYDEANFGVACPAASAEYDKSRESWVIRNSTHSVYFKKFWSDDGMPLIYSRNDDEETEDYFNLVYDDSNNYSYRSIISINCGTDPETYLMNMIAWEREQPHEEYLEREIGEVRTMDVKGTKVYYLISDIDYQPGYTTGDGTVIETGLRERWIDAVASIDDDMILRVYINQFNDYGQRREIPADEFLLQDIFEHFTIF